VMRNSTDEALNEWFEIQISRLKSSDVSFSP